MSDVISIIGTVMGVVKKGVELIDRDNSKSIKFSLITRGFAINNDHMAADIEIANFSEKKYSVTEPSLVFKTGKITALPLKEVTNLGGGLEIKSHRKTFIVNDKKLEYISPIRFPLTLDAGEASRGLVFFAFPKELDPLEPKGLEIKIAGTDISLSAGII